MPRRTLPLWAFMSPLSVLVVGCDIPTSAPIVESRWVVPAQSTSISVANLLPAGVTVMNDSTGFVVSAPSASVSRLLSDDCSACAAANGTTIPKPAFTANMSVNSALPTDVASATLVGGTLQVKVTNNGTFDPLRPSAAAGSAKGYAVITITSGTGALGRDSVDGSTIALPANGGTISRSIALAGPVSGTAGLKLSVVLVSPAGDNAVMNASSTIALSATPTNLKVTTAAVSVVNRSLTSSSTLNLSDIDSTISNHVQGGSLLMNVTNPFSVAGNLTARFSPDGGAPVLKIVSLSAGSSTPSVAFTAAELHALLGHNVAFTLTGAVTSTSGPVTVSPKQVVLVASHLDISLEVGSR